MMLESKTEKIVKEIQSEIQPKTFWEPALEKNVTLYFIDTKNFKKNKKYQTQFLEMYHLLNDDFVSIFENIITKEIIAIAFPLDAKKLVVSSLFKDEDYEKLSEIKDKFQTEITEYLQNL